MEKYDALVIGANNSGLVCGAILAKEGLKTVIVEATKWVGGTGMTIPVPEIDPEVRVNPAATGQGWVNKQVREDLELYDKFEKKILQYAPNLEGHVLGVAGYTPGELAEKFNMTNGDIMYGMMYWGQLMDFRPMPGWANYQTPIKNLYLSGAPVDHGGLTGATGHTAAHTVLGNIGK